MPLLIAMLASDEIEAQQAGWNMRAVSKEAAHCWAQAIGPSYAAWYLPREAAMVAELARYRAEHEGHRALCLPVPKEHHHEGLAHNRCYRPLFAWWTRQRFPAPLAEDARVELSLDLGRGFHGTSARRMQGVDVSKDDPAAMRWFGTIDEYHPTVHLVRLAQTSSRCAENTIIALLEAVGTDNLPWVLVFFSYCWMRGVCDDSAMRHKIITWLYARLDSSTQPICRWVPLNTELARLGIASVPWSW